MSDTRIQARSGICTYASALLIGLTVLIAGCGRQGAMVAPETRVDPASDAAPDRILDGRGGGRRSTIGVYPLQVGNRWHYAYEFSVDTEGDGRPPVVYPAELEVEQIQTEQRFGREYVVEEERYTSPGFPDPILSWWRYRQDRSGLYMADVAGNLEPGAPEPDFIVDSGAFSALGRMSDRLARLSAESRWRPEQRAALRQMAQRLSGSLPPSLEHRPRRGGPRNQEITRLAYPLRRGQHWTIRPDPLFESAVEAHETLRLPAGRFQGWRIRITSELFRPNDRVHVWYGHAGLLALHAHLEGEGTDEAGNVAYLIYEQTEKLDALHLVGRGQDAYGGPEASQGRSAE